MKYQYIYQNPINELCSTPHLYKQLFDIYYKLVVLSDVKVIYLEWLNLW